MRPDLKDDPVQYTSHHGEPIPHRSRNFFVPPPKEIGAVISAWSTLKFWQKARGKKHYWAKVVASSSLILLVVVAALRVGEPSVNGAIGMFVAWFVATGIIAVLFIDEPEPEVCSYVGMEGFVAYEWDGDSPPRERVFCAYDEVSHIRLEGTNFFVNGTYSHTESKTIWVYHNQNGEYAHEGRDRSEEQKPTKDAWHWFDLMTRSVWISRILPRMRKTIREGGTVNFYDKNGAFLVGLTSLSIVLEIQKEQKSFLYSQIEKHKYDTGRLLISFLNPDENPEAKKRRPTLRRDRFRFGNAVQIELTPMGNMQAFITLFEEMITPLNDAKSKPRKSNDDFDDGLGD